MRDQKFVIRQRFERQFRRFAQWVPGMDQLRKPGWTIARLVLALVFILGGFLAILPVFGLWMIPLGLLLLAIDVPALQGPITTVMIRGRRRFDRWRRRVWPR
jgi:hypothetical protein